MKTSHDPRHKHRIEQMNCLFSYSFGARVPKSIKAIISELPVIDKKIEVAAPEWPIDKIAKIDLAILRLAVYELACEKSVPVKVVIDEAVELAKEFGNENSAKFVNGVLGTILKTL